MALTDNENPEITLALNPSSVAENASPTKVTVTVSTGNVSFGDDQVVTVNVGENDDSATEGTDYASVSDFTITITAGQTSGTGTFELTPTDDKLIEGDETISVAGKTESIGSALTKLTLTDDESGSNPTPDPDNPGAPTQPRKLPTIHLSASPSGVAEQNGAETVRVTARIGNGYAFPDDRTVTVWVGSGGDSADSGSDYETVSNFTITIRANRTSGSGSFTLTPIDDTVIEGNESISISGSSPGEPAVSVRGTGVTLVDDDYTEITLTVDPTNVAEDAGATTMTVTASTDGDTFKTERSITVSVGADADSAVPGTDYETVSDFTIAITVGEVDGTETFTLTPVDDKKIEDDETISISGTSPDLTVNGTSVMLEDDDPLYRASVADASAEEGQALIFVVTLDRMVEENLVTMRYDTVDGTATAGEDYEAASGTLTIAPGESTGTVEVLTIDDAMDEGEETLFLRLSEPLNLVLDDPEAIGTIINDDAMPKAWIARYGRTVARHVMEAVDERLHGGAGDSHLTVTGVTALGPSVFPDSSVFPGSGVAVSWQANADDFTDNTGTWQDDSAWEESSAEQNQLALREVLAQSSFLWKSGSEKDPTSPGSQPRWTAWGSGSSTRFDGQEKAVTLEGEVVGVTMGLDAEWERATAGMAFSWNDGEGSYEDAESGDRGEIESTLNSVHPYLRWTGDRFSVWGLLGYGNGEYAVTPENLDRTIRTDLGMHMVGLGARRDLEPLEEWGGIELALRSDVMFVWMRAAKVPGYLRETTTHTSHLRLLLEGSRAFDLPWGALFTPILELGLRHDAGSAETGFGLEVGAGIRYEDTRRGLTLEVRGRKLAAHQADNFAIWGASGSLVIDPGADGLGLSLRVQPSWGESNSGVGNLWQQPAFDLDAVTDDGDPAARIDTEIGYGLPARRGTLMLQSGFGMEKDEVRSMRLEGLLKNKEIFELGLAGERTLMASGKPDHGITLRLQVGL